MARPIRNNAEFFYHPASLRDDRRVKAIRARMGVCGYGLLIMVLETLTDADFTQLDTSELELELLAGDYGVSVTEINSLLQIGEKVGYFTRNDAGFLICPDLNKALEPVFEKRNRSRNAANSDRNEQEPTDTVVSATETPQSVTESTQRKGKDRIVEEKKEKDIGAAPDINPPGIDTKVKKNGNGQMIKPDLPTLTAYVTTHGGTPTMAEQIYNFYGSKGWKVGKSPMDNWNLAASGWISREKQNEPDYTEPARKKEMVY